ncbi:hypothetical protein CCACVL1_22963, partial [Corchorus capsularis]
MVRAESSSDYHRASWLSPVSEEIVSNPLQTPVK